MVVDDNIVIISSDRIQCILQFQLLDAMACIEHFFFQYEQILLGRNDVQILELRTMDASLVPLFLSEQLADPLQFHIVCKESFGGVPLRIQIDQ